MTEQEKDIEAYLEEFSPIRQGVEAQERILAPALALAESFERRNEAGLFSGILKSLESLFIRPLRFSMLGGLILAMNLYVDSKIPLLSEELAKGSWPKGASMEEQIPLEKRGWLIDLETFKSKMERRGGLGR